MSAPHPSVYIHIHPGRSLPIIPVLYPLMEGIKTALLLLLLNIREGEKKISFIKRKKSKCSQLLKPCRQICM